MVPWPDTKPPCALLRFAACSEDPWPSDLFLGFVIGTFRLSLLSRPKSVYSENHKSYTLVTRAWQDHKKAEGAGKGSNGFYGIWRRR